MAKTHGNTLRTASKVTPTTPPSFFGVSDTQDEVALDVCSLSCVLDVFHHISTKSKPPELVVIAGCAIGGSHILRASESQGLPDTLQHHVNLARVSQHDGLRDIAAKVIDVFTVDSVELRQASGYNDGVLLYGRWCARLKAGADQVLHKHGCLAVGRLHLLYAFHTGLNHTWVHPESPDDAVYHLLVPTEPFNETLRGDGIGLVYPAFDVDTFNRADNTAMTMRLIYDVLSQLQAELRRDAVRDDFVRAVLPVPSRRRLEIELEGSGYAIRGDKAIKLKQQATDPKDPGQGAGLLTRLRRWSERWSAEQIDLPPQATPEAYRVLIEQAIETAAHDIDKNTMRAIRERVRGGVDHGVAKSKQTHKPKA